MMECPCQTYQTHLEGLNGRLTQMKNKMKSFFIETFAFDIIILPNEFELQHFQVF